MDLLPCHEDHGGLRGGEDEEGVLELALAAVHGPHVHCAGDLEGGQHLRPHGPLQQTQGAVLAVARRGDQLNVRVGDGGVEDLGEEGGLPHGHLAARTNIQQAVTNLMIKSTLNLIHQQES